jgi:hypothetical protein
MMTQMQDIGPIGSGPALWSIAPASNRLKA